MNLVVPGSCRSPTETAVDQFFFTAKSRLRCLVLQISYWPRKRSAKIVIAWTAVNSGW
jgi:hypothetical protein